MVDKETIQELVNIPIEGIAERLGLNVSRHRCICPFHDDHHPSMSFNIRKNRFACYACGAHGGTIDLVMKAQNIGFLEACNWLGNRVSLTIPQREGIMNKYHQNTDKRQLEYTFDASRYAKFFEHPWLSDCAKRFLFEERKLAPKVVSECKLNSYQDKYGTHWLQIPYYDIDGKLIGIQSRNLDYRHGDSDSDGKNKVARFRFPYGSQCSIYNLNILKLLKPSEPLYIAEGCSDCWSLMSSNHKAIAIPSATLLKPEDIETITRPMRESWRGSFHMYPDQDEPGERLFQQLNKLLSPLGEVERGVLIRHPLPQDCKDYSDYYMKKVKSKE